MATILVNVNGHPLNPVLIEEGDFDPKMMTRLDEGDKDPSDDDLRFDELIEDIDDLNANDVKFIASHLGIVYDNKKNTIKDIKDLLDL